MTPRRSADARDVNEFRGIDDIDSLEHLDTIDWTSDPWDEPQAAGSVERLRWQTRSVKWVAYIVLVLVIVMVLVAGLVGWWYIRQVNPTGDATAPASFTVAEGDTLQSLSERLETEGFVGDASMFRWYVERHGGLEVTPGYYEIARRDHMGNVLGRLRTPPSETYTKVTFPEGFTVQQIAARLDRDMETMTEADFMAAAADPSLVASFRRPDNSSLEGLLFPDTYQVSNGESEAQVIQRMIVQMERVGSQEDIVTKGQKFFQDPYGILTIASLIEREAKTDEDRAKIARVIYNRLAKDMPLGIDATLYYGQDPNTPFGELLELDTPYNTRMHTGLPPTPIANPGRESIRAALNPAPNPSVGDPLCLGLPEDVACEYIYYVLADEEGGHAFAVTDEQHTANVDAARAAGLLD